MAMTQCPACSKVVEHQPNFAITVISATVDDGTRNLLIANDTLVVHALDHGGVCRVAALGQRLSVWRHVQDGASR
jgi:hypothetical protein